MSTTYAWLSPVSGADIFQIQKSVSLETPIYRRFLQLLSEEVWLKHEKSIDGRIKRTLDILRAEFWYLPVEMDIIHTLVSNTVHVILCNWEKMDYNEFLNTWKGAYPPHLIVIPDNDDKHHALSKLMGTTGLYTGYAKWTQKILQKLEK